MSDYSNAVESAESFDSQVQSDAFKISSDYAAIVALSIRQAFASTEITISKNADGSFNTSDVLIFMKGRYILCMWPSDLEDANMNAEISSDGVRADTPLLLSLGIWYVWQNMNTVDVIFPAWPIFLYTNPEYGRLLLEPLFEYQATGQYPNKYSVHDLGAYNFNTRITGHY